MEGHPGANNIKKTPAYNARVLKPKERAYIVDRLTTSRSEYPVTNFKDIRNTKHWFQRNLHLNPLHVCANILTSKKMENEGLDLYREWKTYWTTSTEEGESDKNAKIQSRTILAEILRNIFSKDTTKHIFATSARLPNMRSVTGKSSIFFVRVSQGNLAIGKLNLMPRPGFEPTVRIDICESVVLNHFVIKVFVLCGTINWIQVIVPQSSKMLW